MCVRRRPGMPGLTFNEYRIPYLMKAAFGVNHYAGHVRVLGVLYSYTNTLVGWAFVRRLNFWGLMQITHEDDHHGNLKSISPGFSVKFCRPRFTLNRVY